MSPSIFILNIVQIKLIAPNNDEIPARCKLNIAKSIELPGCPSEVAKDNGGYIVHPVPTPSSTIADAHNKTKDAGKKPKT